MDSESVGKFSEELVGSLIETVVAHWNNEETRLLDGIALIQPLSSLRSVAVPCIIKELREMKRHLSIIEIVSQHFVEWGNQNVNFWHSKIDTSIMHIDSPGKAL